MLRAKTKYTLGRPKTNLERGRLGQNVWTFDANDIKIGASDQLTCPLFLTFFYSK